MSEWILFFVIVVAVPVVCGVAYAPFEKWIEYKHKLLESQAALTAEKAAQYAAHTERLEQRVRVLERIATDGGTHLAAEIEDLRSGASDPMKRLS